MNNGDTEGAVTYTINVSDRAANPAIQVSGGGITFDRTPPEVTLTSLLSDNDGRTGYAKAGNTITLAFTATDTNMAGIGEMAGLIASKTTTISSTGGTAYEALTGLVTTEDIQGNATYRISVTDLAGNTTIVDTTLASPVIIDTVAPTISTLGLSSSHPGYASWATNNNLITMDITAIDATSGLDTISASIAGKPVDTASIDSDTSARASYTLTYVNTVGDGPASFSATLVDKAGNSTTVTTDSHTGTTITSGVTIDRTGPVLVLTSFVSSNPLHNTYAKAADTVTLSFTARDERAGIATAPVVALSVAGGTRHGALIQPSGTSAGGTTTDYTMTYVTNSSDTEGAITYSVTAYDALGNASNTLVDNTGIILDMTPPSLTLGTMLSNNTGRTGYAKTGSEIYLNFTATDDKALAPTTEMAGTIAGKAVGFTAGTAPAFTATYASVVEGDTQGPASHSITVYDLAGNSTTRTDIIASPVFIDTQAPAITGLTISSSHAGHGAWATNGDTITLGIITDDGSVSSGITASGGTIAGIASTGSATSIAYQLDGTNAVPDGTLAFSVKVTDAAGNESPTVTATTDSTSVTIDRSGPSTPTVTYPAGVHKSGTTYFTTGTSIEFTPDATDTGSGTAGFNLDGSSTVSYAAGGTISLDANASAYSLYAVDNVGNVTQTALAITVTQDSTAPQISTEEGNKPTAEKPDDILILTITLSSNELSGAKKIYYWAGNITKEAAGANVKIYLLETPVTTGSFQVPSLTGIGLESFRFSVEDAAGNETENGYLMSYADSVWTFEAAAPRSLSAGSPSSKASPITTYTAPTPRRPTSYFTPIAFSTTASSATTTARWLSPIASEPASTLTRTPTTSAVSTPPLSASAQAKANAILAAYSMPATSSSMDKPPAKSPAPSSNSAESLEDVATTITTTPDSAGDASIFLTGYSSQPISSPNTVPAPTPPTAPDNTRNPASDRTPNRNPDRSNGNSSGLPPAEAVMPPMAQTKRHDEGSEEPDTL
jgi:hypothetical protein